MLSFNVFLSPDGYFACQLFCPAVIFVADSTSTHSKHRHMNSFIDIQ